MQGMMMDRPLQISELLRYAEDIFPNSEIVSARVEGDIHRYTYRDAAARSRRLARALMALGIETGDRVATLAWNGYRHFELYYGISGMGAVCHTLNPRLAPEQLLYILAHAEDRLLFSDLTFLPLLEKLAAHLPKDMRIVAMANRKDMPASGLEGLLCYEDLLDAQDDDFDWPELPEDTASSLCYTSGTTGNPKGALYSHRSTVLHAMMAGMSFPSCLSPGKRILPVVPLFHVNAWGLPYAAPLTGASIVFPGMRMDGASLFDLMEKEDVFSSWGVPTIWMGLLAEIRQRGRIPNGFGEVIIGGSAAPRAMVEAFESMGVTVAHAWGMTEMSPIGTRGLLTTPHTELPADKQIDLKVTQGRRVFGVDLKIVDEKGRAQPHDGEATGELYVRGNTIVSGYFKNDEASAAAVDSQGWFGTGDVASIDEEGFVRITDRSKDLIKSGGEWISSLDLENKVMSHPHVANCAVIAIPHPKWDERPLLIVVPTEDSPQEKQPLLDHIAEDFARWQVPDDVVFVDSLPLTSTGKVSKLTLRATYKTHVSPE